MIHKIFDSQLMQIKKDIENSNFPKTAKALYRFYEKITSINSILNKATNNNEVYAAKILLRALFEHLMISYYIYSRFQNEKSDKVGEEYYQEYFIYEFFKQTGYGQKIENIRNKKTKNIHGLDYVKAKFPEFDKMTEKQYQDVNKVGSCYKVDNILKYINAVETESASIVKLHDYMLGFLDEYNKLSSYVHGGPFSEKFIFDDAEDLQKELSNINGWTASASNAIKEHILLFLTEDKPDHLLLLKPIMDERMKKK